MDHLVNHSKDSIKQQILNNLASLWGVYAIDELDPVVQLLIEVMSSEIYTIRQEQQDSHLRILEKIANLLTPNIFSFSKPAHSIARMDIIEPTYFIKRNTELQVKKLPQEKQNYGVNSITFVPITDTLLVSAKINYLICERRFYRIDNGVKTLHSQAGILDERINQNVWIGLTVDSEVENLKNVSLYLDFPQSDKKFEKYSLLSYTGWSYEGSPIEMRSGLPVWSDTILEKSIFDKYELLNQIDASILKLYNNQFLTIKSDLQVAEMTYKKIPDEIADIFPENVISKLQPCVWLKVTFPPHILAENLYDLTVHLNAFPVANKIPYSIIHSAQEKTSVIPLRTQNHQYFLTVEKVSDSSGTDYTSIPYASDYGHEKGVYTLKQGGMERFDVRNAKTYIERLFDLLRSEKVAFSSVEMDNLRNLVNKLSQNLKDIEAAYDSLKNNGLEEPYYLLVNTSQKDEKIFVDYCATNSELANNLHSGKTLIPTKSLPMVNESCKLLKITSGGKNTPNPTQKLSAYRYAISSHDRIVTHENIVNFLKMELGDKIRTIEVKKGVSVSCRPKEGLIRTTDIHLKVTPGYMEIVRQMEPEILTQLHDRSSDTYTYQLFLN